MRAPDARLTADEPRPRMAGARPLRAAGTIRTDGDRGRPRRADPRASRAPARYACARPRSATATTPSGCGSWQSPRTWPVEVARAALEAGLTAPGREPRPGGGAEDRGRSGGRVALRRPAPVEQGAARGARLRCDPLGRLRRAPGSRATSWRGGGAASHVSCSRSTSPARRPRPACLRTRRWREATVAGCAVAALVGLMTIAPMGASAEEARPCLRRPARAARSAGAGGRRRPAGAVDGHERRRRGGRGRGGDAGPHRHRALRAARLDAAILGRSMQARARQLRPAAGHACCGCSLIARVILSWTNPTGGGGLVAFVYQATEPILAPIRRVLPPDRRHRLVAARRDAAPRGRRPRRRPALTMLDPRPMPH